MSKQQKQYALIAAAVIGAYLLYRWYTGKNAQNAAATGSPVNTAGTDYATLAGQEQGDVAALQGQEQSDVAALQQQEGGDVAGLTQTLAGITGQIAGINAPWAQVQQEIAALASGQQKMTRTLAGTTVTTRRGSAFYRYYMRVTGHAPPAHVSSTNFVYQAWKAGVKAIDLRPAHNHAGQRNGQVAHPNPAHRQQSGAHRPSRPAPPKRYVKPLRRRGARFRGGPVRRIGARG